MDHAAPRADAEASAKAPQKNMKTAAETAILAATARPKEFPSMQGEVEQNIVPLPNDVQTGNIPALD